MFASVYSSPAAEVEDQADFLNSAARFTTENSPEAVRQQLNVIEQELEKEVPYRFGPRTIDLDILLYDNLIIDTDTLTIPHPRMHRRRFVLQPLTELLDASCTHPTEKRTWENLLTSTSDSVEKVALILP